MSACYFAQRQSHCWPEDDKNQQSGALPIISAGRCNRRPTASLSPLYGSRLRRIPLIGDLRSTFREDIHSYYRHFVGSAATDLACQAASVYP
jgi:hypothetical protein